MKYAIDLLLDLAQTNQIDGTHRVLQWAMSQKGSDGSWARTAITGRTHGQGEPEYTGFGRANLDVQAGDEFEVSLFAAPALDSFDNQPYEIQSVDFVRLTVRPAHDMALSSNLPVSPFNSNDTDGLVRGASATLTPNAVSAAFRETFAYGAAGVLSASFRGVPASYDSLNFEFSAYVGVTVGGGGIHRLYYKSDPELIIGKRGS